MVPIDLPQIAAGLNDTKVCLTARTDSGGDDSGKLWDALF